MSDGAMWGILIAGGYLAGSIPFGLLIARTRGIDIRQHGSGNIGATNVYRIVGKREGRLCFALDFLKGFAPSLGAGMIAGVAGGAEIENRESWLWLCVAAAAILGHMYPMWLRFKGGKGVATGFGALVGVWPMLSIPAALALVTWIVSLYVTSFVGFSSCVAAASLPIWVLLSATIGPRLDASLPGLDRSLPYGVVTVALACFVVIRHRSNIMKMVTGDEKRVGWGLAKGFRSENGGDAARAGEQT